MVSERAFQRALFDVSALLFATSAAVTIVCSTSTKAIAGIIMHRSSASGSAARCAASPPRSGAYAEPPSCRSSDAATLSIWHVPLCLLSNVRDLSGGSDWSAPNSARGRDSLIRAEISLIADLNSLQGRKKFPVRMRRELARKALV
jgi:hypothetical protein